ncbi:glycoside hydrolase family 97 catalytic domain-containing protein [Asanoa sp. WMMD1127]|uniref:glycoside hydrolase family 97 catalytic domain-containing protein n=1 Tax=Asanoa sp. WMMD1127 TaxID=3016107 RepID=UPI00241612B1|nr:glycoside hydrolase family 97 catalytic domain-containing protein [Asanoa sp. WMMD1127]MDG4823260.1 glycoside hydrolase family 97 catalytic domain-containing protein [Asanoa sp. WMMD1127]
MRRASARAAAAAGLALVMTLVAPGVAPAAGRAGAAATKVSSPDGRLTVAVSADGGQLRYAVRRDNRTLVLPSALGLRLTDGSTLGAGVTISRSATRARDTTWRPVWGADAVVRDRHRELTVRLRQADGRVFDLVVRAYDDGVAIRYSVPRQDALSSLDIVDEATEFALAGDPTAWWTPRSLAYDGDEQLWQETAYSAMGDTMTPATFRWADGTHLSIHEADLVDYAAMTLVRESGRLRAALTPTPDRAAAVVTTTGRATPWRALTITKDAAGLVDSHLLENLNPPCAICDQDTSWMKPTKYVGIWWALQHQQYTWEEGPRHGATTERAKSYIDFAAANGIGGLLAEGWNKGWEGSWADQDFTTPADDFDLEAVVAYGKSKGVEFVAHNETGADIDNYEAQIDEAFALYERLGIHYLKTGYVGQIPGQYAYSQRSVNHFRLVLEKAAAHKINVLCHECVHATGEVRTFPNAIAREAVRGQEYDAFSAGNSPAHTLTIPFTRMLSGPMDYTPGIMNILWDPQGQGRRVHTTVGKQLSYYVNYFSGVQMAADLPEHYAGAPGLAFIADVPARWDESRVLSARVADHLVTARRSGSRWYVGAMTGERAQALRYRLDFLGRGFWVAESLGDAAATDYETDPTPLAVNRSLVTRHDTFVAALEKSGGQAVRFRPATAADLASVPRYVEPRPRVTAVAAPATAAPGDIVTIRATVTNRGSVPGGKDVVMTVGGTDIRQTRYVRVDPRSSATVVFQARLTGERAVVTVDGLRAVVRLEEPDDAVPAPANLRVTGFAGALVALSWDPVPGAAYQVFRRPVDGVYGAPLATVPSPSYVDTDVAVDNTYAYVVRAVVGGRTSIPSNEVVQQTIPQPVRVTWRVRVPANTPAGDTVHLPGALPEMGPWDPGKVAMTEVEPGIWEATLSVLEGTVVQYKYTRGSWETVERWGQITGTTNRSVAVTYGTTGTQVVDDTSLDPATPDIHEAVRAWIDLPT